MLLKNLNITPTEQRVVKICAVMIFFVFVLRWFHIPLSETLNSIIGVAPNFFATPIVMLYSKSFILKTPKQIINKNADWIVFFVLSIILLVLWEYARLAIGNNPIDKNDIIASIISGFIFLGFILLSSKQKEIS